MVEIPVCYEDEFAPDLEHVASQARLVARRSDRGARRSDLSRRLHRFHAGLSVISPACLPALATPRRATPRIAVAPGSVAIGGAQTGIYPQASPGGWNVIGRTPRRLFDANRTPPALLKQGDGVRFCRITRREFEALSA